MCPTLYSLYIISFLHVKATDLKSIIIDISKTQQMLFFVLINGKI